MTYAGLRRRCHEMAENVDVTQGWCCDGRTWNEHAHADGQCCQPEGTQLDDLPAEGQQKARARLEASG
jgi:hypothetical protein